jgi:hypothetical protein
MGPIPLIPCPLPESSGISQEVKAMPRTIQHTVSSPLNTYLIPALCLALVALALLPAPLMADPTPEAAPELIMEIQQGLYGELDPGDVATDEAGNIYVVDVTLGQILLYTQLGGRPDLVVEDSQLCFTIDGGTRIAAGNGLIYVVSDQADVALFDTSGNFLHEREKLYHNAMVVDAFARLGPGFDSADLYLVDKYNYPEDRNTPLRAYDVSYRYSDHIDGQGGEPGGWGWIFDSVDHGIPAPHNSIVYLWGFAVTNYFGAPRIWVTDQNQDGILVEPHLEHMENGMLHHIENSECSWFGYQACLAANRLGDVFIFESMNSDGSLSKLDGSGNLMSELCGVSGEGGVAARSHLAVHGYGKINLVTWDGGREAFKLGIYGYPPRIQSISDVSGDNGGWVRISWAASVLDDPFRPTDVTGYTIYRSSYGKGAEDLTPEDRAERKGWEVVGTVPARGEAQYSFIAPTHDPDDPEGENPTYYFVSAFTDLGTFHDSQTSSGSSVDNLGPLAPVEDGPANQAFQFTASPNPFNARVVLAVETIDSSPVHARIYDLRGRQVACFQGRSMEGGRCEFVWDGRDRQGQVLSTGIYLARIQVGNEVTTSKLTLAK